MNLIEPSPALLESATRIQCAPCEAARANWASGGYHLSCRPCESRAVTGQPPHVRDWIYARMLANACAVEGSVEGCALPTPQHPRLSLQVNPW